MKFEFNIDQYVKEIKKNQNEYFRTFINRKTLSTGILVLQPGEEDTQIPHEIDEIYYVIRGNGYLRINKKDYSVSDGKVFFVPKNIPHHFFGNSKELVVLYFFGGPDS
jgi:mannose-6-phosphate isomerase-like protein (cupin superfamily)